MPMPNCISRVVFETAFMDEIVEQQSQSNPILLTYSGVKKGMAIAGRISRPEIYHIGTKMRPN